MRSFFGSAKARDVLEARQNLSLLDPVAAIVLRQAAKLAKADAEELAANLDARVRREHVRGVARELELSREPLALVARELRALGYRVEPGLPPASALA